MQIKYKDTIIYLTIIILALCASFLVSPIWGGAALFWIGLIITAFFLFATLGTLFSDKLEE